MLAAATPVGDGGTGATRSRHADSARLTDLAACRASARIAEAEHARGTGDFRAIRETFDADAHAVPERALVGTWRCRQMKLGGMTGYAVFNWFPCRISKVNGGIWFEKQGTQRMAGYLYPEDGVWVYLGAQSAKGEPLHRYSGSGASVGAAINPDDQVGLLVGHRQQPIAHRSAVTRHAGIGLRRD